MEEEEKIVIKILLLSILTILITSFLILFIGVAKVSALSCSTQFTYGNDVVTGTPSNTSTTYGSSSVGGITQTGHYTNLNNIQYECRNNANYNGKYRVTMTGRITNIGLLTTKMNTFTWQSQIRNQNNVAVTTTNKTFTLTQIELEQPRQIWRYTLIADIEVSNITQVFIGFKTTNSVTSYNQYTVTMESLTIAKVTDDNQGVIDTINGQTEQIMQNSDDNTDIIIENIQDVNTSITGGINSINQNGNTNTQRIIDAISQQTGALQGSGVNITGVSSSEIANMELIEGIIRQNYDSDSNIINNMNGNELLLTQTQKENAVEGIDSIWDIFLQNQKISALVIAVLALGLIALLFNR